jgi:WD40 repeat protein
MIYTGSKHPNGVRAVAFSRDGLRLVSAGNDGRIRIQGLASWQEVLSLRGHAACRAFDPDGRLLVGGSDKTAKIWDATPIEE